MVTSHASIESRLTAIDSRLAAMDSRLTASWTYTPELRRLDVDGNELPAG